MSRSGIEGRDQDRDSRMFKLLRRWLSGRRGMTSKHGASLALDILAANGVDELAVVRGGGRRIHLSPHDKVIAASVIRMGSFGADNMAAFAQVLAQAHIAANDMVFVNVGANIGTACLNAYEIGFRRFVAIEPEPENFRLLELNLADLPEADVRLERLAIGAESGTATLHRHKSNKGAHSLLAGARNVDPANTVEVPVLPLTAVLTPGQPYVLYVDVEGYEPQVLRGGGDAMARDCRAIALEVTPAKYTQPDRELLCRTLAAWSPGLTMLPGRQQHPSASLGQLMAEHGSGHFDVALINERAGSNERARRS